VGDRLDRGGGGGGGIGFGREWERGVRDDELCVRRRWRCFPVVGQLVVLHASMFFKGGWIAIAERWASGSL